MSIRLRKLTAASELRMGMTTLSVDQSSFAPVNLGGASCAGCGMNSMHSPTCPQAQAYINTIGVAPSQTITWTPPLAAPAVAEDAPSEEREARRCNCPREAFALNGAGCSCGGV